MLFVKRLSQEAIQRRSQRDRLVKIKVFKLRRDADDIDIISIYNIELNYEGKRYGLNMNFEKTKTMVFGEKDWPRKMEIDGNQLENVEKFTYLGCLNTYNLDSKKEILVRIAKATAALSAMDKIWK